MAEKYKIVDNDFCPFFEVGETVVKCVYDSLEEDKVNDSEEPMCYSPRTGIIQYVPLTDAEVL